MACLAKEREGLLPTGSIHSKMADDKYFPEDKLQQEFEYENVPAHIKFSRRYPTQWVQAVNGNGTVIYSDKEASRTPLRLLI
jgi:hypothetical protein